jgi:hypothetical protein
MPNDIQMSSLIPMPRDEMRSLKAKDDEIARIYQVEANVRSIYQSAVQLARTSTKTQYIYTITSYSEIPFIVTNMDDILSRLRILFPDCSVQFTSIKMAMGSDRQMHDISNIDPKAIPFIGQVQIKECISIDWS